MSRHVITTLGYFLCVNARPWQFSELKKSWQKQFALLLHIFAVVHINVLASYLGLIHNKKGLFIDKRSH